MSLGQLKVMSAIEQCRSAALGGHVLHCNACEHSEIAYNSCRNRHCPKCQATAARRWLDARQADLLPVDYYHVVFTLPAPISAIAYTNKAVIYGLLFEVAAETLRTIAADPKHLGAQIGVTLVLHLGIGTHAPSARAWHRSRRRAVARRCALGLLQAGLLPAGAGAVAAVSPALPRSTRDGASQRSIAVLGEYAALADATVFADWLQDCGDVSGWSMQAPVRRTGGGVAFCVVIPPVAISDGR